MSNKKSVKIKSRKMLLFEKKKEKEQNEIPIDKENTPKSCSQKQTKTVIYCFKMS